MELMTINHSALTWELFWEGFELTFNRKAQKNLRLCGIILALCGALALAVQMLFHKMLVIWFPLLFLGIFTVIWSFFLPKNTAKKKYKAMCRWKKDVIPQRDTEFYQDLLIILDGDTELRRVEYANVREVRETEHLLVLLCEDGAGILLEKAGFQENGLEKAKELIENGGCGQTALPEL